MVGWPSGLGICLQNKLVQFDSGTDLMTKKEIKQQIEIIGKVTKDVCKSKETASQFLIDAGIIKVKKMKKKFEKH